MSVGKWYIVIWGVLYAPHAVGMKSDLQGIELNEDISMRLFRACDARDDTTLIDWIHCRGVCKLWCQLLTYKFMAEQVGSVLQTFQKSELVQALNDGKKGRLGLLYKFYQYGEKESGDVLKRLFDSDSLVGVPKAPWLKRLLSLGAPPDFCITQIYDTDKPTKKMITSSALTCIVQNLGSLDEHDQNSCLDLLLQYKSGKLWTEFDWNNLFDRAKKQSTLPVILRLLQHKPYLGKEFEAIETLCAREFPDRALQLFVIAQLVDRGAPMSDQCIPLRKLLEEFAAKGSLDMLYVFIAKDVALSYDCVVKLCVHILLQKKSEITQCCLAKLYEKYPVCLFHEDVLEGMVSQYKDFCIEKLFAKPIELAAWRSKEGKSVLHIFAAQNNVVHMNRLLDAKLIEINILDKSGRLPLFYAVNHGSIEAARALLDRGAEYKQLAPQIYEFIHTAQPSREAIVDAIRSISCSNYKWAKVFSYDFIRLLLYYLLKPAHGRVKCADGKVHVVIQKGTLYTFDEKLWAYILFNIMKISHRKDRDWFIKEFLKKVPGILNIPDHHGDTILHHAARFDKQSLVDYLVQLKGIDRNMTNDQGYTYRDLLKIWWKPRLQGVYVGNGKILPVIALQTVFRTEGTSKVYAEV